MPPLEFKLVDIVIVSKNMREIPSPSIKGVFHFDVKVEMRVQAEKNLVMPFVQVDIREDINPEPVASITCTCIFVVPEFHSQIHLNESGVYVIPVDLEKTLSTITISTTRGIIYSEFRGTYLNRAIMPVVFVQEMKTDNQENEGGAATP